MSHFIETVSQAICEYKKILKRKLPQQSYSKKLRELGIKRTQLKRLDETGIFQVAHKVLGELEETYTNTAYPSLYSGVHEFVGHFKNIISNHKIENDKVINTTQKASAAIIETAQILALSKSKFTKDHIDKLEYCIDGIIQYGTCTQIRMVFNAIQKRGLEKVDACTSLLEKLETHLDNIPEEENLEAIDNR